MEEIILVFLHSFCSREDKEFGIDETEQQPVKNYQIHKIESEHQCEDHDEYGIECRTLKKDEGGYRWI
jgi:hypothetical protein